MKLNMFLLHFNLLFFSQISAGGKQTVQDYPVTLYVGTYTPPDGNGSGISIFEQENSFANFDAVGNLFIPSATFMAMDAEQNFIYAISERTDYESGLGIVWALRITHPSGNLTIGNTVGIPGYRPFHITLDPTSRFVLISNFGSGNVVVYQLNATGLIGSQTDDLVAPGDDPSNAKAHMVQFDPNAANRVAICYMQLDALYFYEFSVDGHLTPYTITLANGTEFHVRAEVEPGSRPRHVAYSLDGKYFYVISEEASTVTTFQSEIDQSTGLYKRIQTISTHPEGYSGRNRAAEIALSPNGLFLYASERGDSSFAIYAVDANTGLLTSTGFQSTTGERPRHFVIEPSGSKLYVGNQDGNNVDVFSVNEAGGLTLDQTIEGIQSPAFILYANIHG